MENFKFNLGDELKDKITGFKGIARGRTQYLTGCNTYGLQSQKLSTNGAPSDWVWLDENQLVRVKTKKVTMGTKARETGGPLNRDQVPPIK